MSQGLKIEALVYLSRLLDTAEHLAAATLVSLSGFFLQEAGDNNQFCWRNLFSCINLLRILNKLTKWKHSRTMVSQCYSKPAPGKSQKNATCCASPNPGTGSPQGGACKAPFYSSADFWFFDKWCQRLEETLSHAVKQTHTQIFFLYSLDPGWK